MSRTDRDLIPPSLIRFSVRCPGGGRDIDGLVPELEAAFGCRLIPGRFNTIPAFVGHMLGLTVGVFPWVGRGGSEVIRIDTYPASDQLMRDADGEHIDVEWIDVSPAVIHLLAVNGVGEWYMPDEDDVAADLEFGAALDREFFGDAPESAEDE